MGIIQIRKEMWQVLFRQQTGGTQSRTYFGLLRFQKTMNLTMIALESLLKEKKKIKRIKSLKGSIRLLLRK